MKLSKVAICLTIALALLFVANNADAQTYPPPFTAWTDILNMTGSTSMLSGTYYDVGSGQSPIPNTDLAGITDAFGNPQPNQLTMPANITSLNGGSPPQGGPIECGLPDTTYPLAFIESNFGSAALGAWVRGVGFLGSFNDSSGPLTGLSGNIFEAVFFHEDQCYGATPSSQAREYGFFLATFDNSIWAYWGTNVNRTSQAVGQFQLTAATNTVAGGSVPVAGQQYYYEMYPVSVGPGDCVMQIAVYDSSINIVYASNPNYKDHQVTGNSIQVTDSGFCSAVENDSGYVSANITPADSTITGPLPGSSLNLSLQRIFVGK
jgi:hypothetical protein